MGVVFMMNHGGSSGLNYTIKDYPSFNNVPEGPHDNDIAVITSIKMSKYVIGFNQPIGEPNGTVWITMTDTGSTTFSVVRKNAIIITIGQCKQLVNGTWIDIKAYYAIAGQWNQFSNTRVYLFDVDAVDYNCSDVTGGWKPFVYNGAVSNSSKNGMFMQLNSSYEQTAEFSTVSEIDSNNFSNLIIEFKESNANLQAQSLFLTTDKGFKYIFTDNRLVYKIPIPDKMLGHLKITYYKESNVPVTGNILISKIYFE